MSRRGPNILGQIFKSIWESNSGKIYVNQNGYRFTPPSKAMLDKIFPHAPVLRERYAKPRPDKEGKDMFLNHQRSVNCPNLAVYAGIYPKITELAGSVPYSVCRKCEFHSARIPRKYPFPRCLFKAKTQPELSAAMETTKIFNKAVQDTKKMFDI